MQRVSCPSYTRAVEWHPILAAQEKRSGRWIMVDPQGREYGTITLVRVPIGETTEGRYKVMYRGELLGWATTLRLSCERLHTTYVRSHGPGKFQGYPDQS